MINTEAVRILPGELAAVLGQQPPTAEQAAVIAAPTGPTLVVAGAGAGKTETMAARVVWMVANSLVTPDQVLGLTFTRKAAHQLTVRVRQRLARLAGSDVLRRLDPTGALRERIVSGEPEISTYHSYAGRLITEHGLLVPVEPSSRLLSETELWQLAYRVVSGWDGVLTLDYVPATITESVLSLSGQLAEHLVDPDDLHRESDRFARLVDELPPGPRQSSDPSTKLTKPRDVQLARLQLLPLVERLREVMNRDRCLDFGSQMSLAARLAADHPSVGAGERQRFRLVLLDEYQDTGHAQRVLLSSLFGGGSDEGLAVTAVGDPMQSIYGWRGASAANLPRFTNDFPRRGGRPAPVLQLTTSWRNPPEALALANIVAAPLRGRGVEVNELSPRPGAEDGDVRLALHESVIDEREWVADRIAAEYARAEEAGLDPPTAAVLIRRNADAEPIAEVLRSRGLPVDVVGVGGLLRTPEVADLVAMLRMIADPLAGGAAMRILTGSRWQLGIGDLRALWNRARGIGTRSLGNATGALTDFETLTAALESAVPGERSEQSGLIDAIADPGPAHNYSVGGYRRITELGAQLSGLRLRMSQPLTDFVAEVERVIGIGTEARARRRSVTDSEVGREHLDAFADVVADYADGPSATLSGLLAFLTAADDIEDGLAPGEVEVAPHRVQVLTVHAAKGLEWQVVAVPHISRGVFPSGKASPTWLTSAAELPTSLRGDRATHAGDADGVPVLNVSQSRDRKQLENELHEHNAAIKQKSLAEDRRLFYVAITRTERALYVSGYHWDAGKSRRGPSELLSELHDAATASPGTAVIETWAPMPDDDAVNPLSAVANTAVWPADPLGVRRADLEFGADAIRRALAVEPAIDTRECAAPEQDPLEDDPEGWAADAAALLAERNTPISEVTEVALPGQLSVSQVVELVADPAVLARRLRRPVPFAPNPLARRGTAFHAWVERRFGATRLLDMDELPGAADTGAAADADLEALKEAFDRSTWALRSPVEVEVPFETVVGSVVVRGRMDAVFEDPDGGWTVVDWKTGTVPAAGEQHAVAVQLAAYRIAWHELMSAAHPERSIALTDVRAAFHYVRSGRTVSPPDLPDRERLAAMVSRSAVASHLERAGDEGDLQR